MTFSKLAYLKDLHGCPMKPSTFRVLVTVFSYTNANGHNAFPGSARLARDCCMSVDTVNRALKELVADGWLRRVSRGGRSSDGAHWAAEYTLTTPWGQDEPQYGNWEPQHGVSDWVNLANESGQPGTHAYPSDHESTDHDHPIMNAAAGVTRKSSFSSGQTHLTELVT